MLKSLQSTVGRFVFAATFALVTGLATASLTTAPAMAHTVASQTHVVVSHQAVTCKTTTSCNCGTKTTGKTGKSTSKNTTSACPCSQGVTCGCTNGHDPLNGCLDGNCYGFTDFGYGIGDYGFGGFDGFSGFGDCGNNSGCGCDFGGGDYGFGCGSGIYSVPGGIYSSCDFGFNDGFSNDFGNSSSFGCGCGTPYTAFAHQPMVHAPGK